MPSTEIERHVSVTPTVGPQEWGLMDQQAKALAMSDIIPSAYRRKPANVLVAALTGRQHGWDVLTAMRNGHVIEGTWGLKPEAMLGMVRQAGHSVTADIGNAGATVTGKRDDTGDEMTFTFTLDDAVTAGLCTIKDGKPYSRSKSGQKLPWEQYPQMMCYWRAVGMLCRMLFSDVTLGAYSVEELGAQIDADGQIIEVGMIDHAPEPEQEPTPLSDEVWAKIREEAGKQEVDLEVVLDTAFPDGRPDPMTDRELPHFRDVFKRIVAQKVAAQNAEKDVAEQSADAPVSGQWVSADTGEAPAERDDGSMRKASKKQVGLVKGHYTRIGLGSDRKGQLDVTIGIVGRDVKSHNDLNAAEISKLIDYLSTLPTHDGVSEPATEPAAAGDDEIVDAEIVEDES